jgi:hypothetical protein
MAHMQILQHTYVLLVIALAQRAQVRQVQIAFLAQYLFISNLPQNSVYQAATQTNINLQLQLLFVRVVTPLVQPVQEDLLPNAFLAAVLCFLILHLALASQPALLVNTRIPPITFALPVITNAQLALALSPQIALPVLECFTFSKVLHPASLIVETVSMQTLLPMYAQLVILLVLLA